MARSFAWIHGSCNHRPTQHVQPRSAPTRLFHHQLPGAHRRHLSLLALPSVVAPNYLRIVALDLTRLR